MSFCGMCRVLEHMAGLPCTSCPWLQGREDEQLPTACPGCCEGAEEGRGVSLLVAQQAANQ